ncbi:MAG: hypothetical protein DWQ02_19875 [Bacteroidetes bacterium]|nr:MAG: hypothetical protein DWQ02_19875 [Bacteroidota bacterium]
MNCRAGNGIVRFALKVFIFLIKQKRLIMKFRFKGFQGLLVLILLLNSQLGVSQVAGINYTLSPSTEYVWWDDKSGLNDGLLLGGKLGIGFGEYLELRGTYMQAAGLKTNFDDFGIPDFSDSFLPARNVKLSRWGGELKANIGKGKMLPFLTLGTGVQSIQLDTFSANQHIYVNVGAGVVFSLADRYTFTLETKNASYNFNSGRNLLSPEDKLLFDLTDNDFEVNRLRKNWSLEASLQFYLGGRRPGELSELDKAYMATFLDGLKGLRIPIEPALAKVNFDNSLPYRDTWMFGGYAGLDFNEYVGIRGFYLRAMKNGEISTNFDDLSMYGGELQLRLNASSGLTPYIMLGGGQLNVEIDYEPRDSIPARSQAFASGGIGITIPISNRFNLFGNARALLTSGAKVENLQATDQIQTSTMYSFGAKFILGRKSDAKAVFNSEMEIALQTQQVANDERAAALKREYESKIVDLENQLNEAYAQQDIEKAADLLKEKEEAELVVEELENREDEIAIQQLEEGQKSLVYPTLQEIKVSSNSFIQLTPAEFESLLEEILEHMEPRANDVSPLLEREWLQNNTQTALQQKALEDRITELEKLLIQMNERESAGGEIAKLEQSARDESIRRDLAEYSSKLLLEIQKLNEIVANNSKDIIALQNQEKELNVVDTTISQRENEGYDIEQTTVTEGNILNVQSGGEYLQKDTSAVAKLTYEGMSGFAGFNLGGQTTFNVGLRWHYGIGKSRFELMPEAFFGFGSPSAFGLTVNGVLPMPIKKSPVTPYLGTGLGFMQIAEDGQDKVRLNYNFIFGTYLKVLNGKMYVDFTARNLFKFNQVIVGYRFSF